MENSSKLCLVTGASGVVGFPLVLELLRRGHKVRVIVRKHEIELPTEVEQIVGDILDEKILEIAAFSCEWVFHLAAKLHINNPTEELENEYRSTNLTATLSLLEKSKNADKFIFFSTINVYGPTNRENIVCETDQINPTGFYSKFKAEAEKHVLQSKNGVVLRLSAVYGSRMKGNYLSVLSIVKKGIFVFVGDGENRRTLIHHNDAARAAIFLAEHGDIGEIYNVSDGKIHTFRDIVLAMHKGVGKIPKNFAIPVNIVKAFLKLSDKLASFLRITPPISNELLDKLLEDMAINSNKLYNLGFRNDLDLEQGWKETIEKR